MLYFQRGVKVNVVNIVNVSDVEPVLCTGAREAVWVESPRRAGLQNNWEQLETDLSDHSEPSFSHGICSSCYQSIMKTQLENAAADKS